MENSNVFNELYGVNVNDYTEEKNGLTYLTWSYAWAEIKKRYPDATYEIKKFENNLPYVYDTNTGYMVFTTVTIENITHEMWLPVMDGANKAMKATPYEYATKYGKKTVEPATMFDINKTIMRCLVKNLAMFGLGLYIYAGEDLPEQEKDDLLNQTIDNNKIQALAMSISNNNISNEDTLAVLAKYGYKSLEEIKVKDYMAIVDCLKKVIK